MNKFDEIMAKLSKSDKEYLSHFLRIKHDKIARNILLEMVTDRPSISYKEMESYANKAHIFFMMYRMDKIGLTSSAMENGNRTYTITKEGIAFVNEHIRIYQFGENA